MRIAIDLDGVLYDFQGAYRYMINAYRGVDMPPVQEAFISWDSYRVYGEPADHDWMWDEGVRQGLFRYGHVVRGGIVAVRTLAGMGHTLVVVTHRPREAFKDTIDWLSYVQLPFSEVHILSDGQPKSSVAGDILIDDKGSNVAEWCQHRGHRAILFKQPWNETPTDLGPAKLTVADGWPAVVEAVRGMSG